MNLFTSVRTHFALTSVREHIASAILDERYQKYLDTHSPQSPPDVDLDPWEWLDTILYVLHVRVTAVICDTWGHTFTSENADPENGGETLRCTRCGYNERVYF